MAPSTSFLHHFKRCATSLSPHRVVLHRTLFKSNEVLMGCLLHVRALCEAASSSANGLGEGEAAISLVKVDHTVTLTLAQFLDSQKQQGETALKQLNALRDSVVEIVWRACVVSPHIS